MRASKEEPDEVFVDATIQLKNANTLTEAAVPKQQNSQSHQAAMLPLPCARTLRCSGFGMAVANDSASRLRLMQDCTWLFVCCLVQGALTSRL